jgi:hypothetical protein
MKVLVIKKVFSRELRQPQVVQSMFGSTEPHFASVPATFGASATRERVKNLLNIKYFHGRSRPCPHQWRPRSGNGKVRQFGFVGLLFIMLAS